MDSHVPQHVRRRLDGLLTNLVHADPLPAVLACHESTACSFSGRGVHASSLASLVSDAEPDRTQRLPVRSRQTTISMRFSAWLASAKLTPLSGLRTTSRATNRLGLFLRDFHG
jgi:hypothetical protein